MYKWYIILPYSSILIIDEASAASFIRYLFPSSSANLSSYSTIVLSVTGDASLLPSMSFDMFS